MDLLILISVINMKLENNELIKINGGAINATWLNSLARLISIAIEVGRMIGTSFRRITGKNYC